MENHKIPQYHSSYTEEENQKIHEYITNASDHELVESIYELCNLYPEEEQEALHKAINQFISEIYSRDILNQKYNALLECRDNWNNYVNKLMEYQEVLLIREYYQRFKNDFKSKTTNISSATLLELFITQYKAEDERFLSKKTKKVVRLIRKRKQEFIRRCTFSEDSKRGIRKPEPPEIFYSSLDEIPVEKHHSWETLEKLGTANLQYLLTLLLRFVDAEGNDNKAASAITFLTRRYSYESHKKNSAIFSTQTLSYENLKEKSMELLEQIKKDKADAEDLEKNIQ